ncbi:hypothetical protein FKR81_12030 [Lentzea tibetensis]|uniref:Uncharacterized protein n=1 Tax=Lentzea tibetensis TaxID=2591470 RepID=A0A563EX33_9PSEU|nr:hypothetical protein [Lentzea tibetensis]TWP52287.1 hypothetical protein FKR81_12030 [Lentzea tibetensis]
MHVVDVRRASGGLRLLVRPVAARQWSARLPYPRAGQLIEAIRDSHACAVPEVSLRYQPEAGTGEATLACGQTEVLLDAAEVAVLLDCLRAHMPDRMKPLPG